jgi:hypothetical protein
VTVRSELSALLVKSGGKVEVKFTLEYSTKAHSGSRDIALIFL